MVKKNILAIIPARGGSKRIPKKNIIDILGKPMIAWTIEEARKSKFITNVIVSTDDSEIADVSRFYGAEVPFLRNEHADDYSPVSDATINCLKQYCKTNAKPDIIVQLMANCPNRKASDMDSAISEFIENSRVFQISCFQYGWMNPWWAHKIGESGAGIPVFSEELRMMRSQDQEELYCPTGATWIALTDELINTGSFYGKNYALHEISWEAAVDIDDYTDLKMAQILMMDETN
jgi:CMP-N-acetylneuraminic acid synthetase